MKAKPLSIGLTAIAIVATPLMVLFVVPQVRANTLCSQQPNDQNCNHQDPLVQGCSNDASTALSTNIKDDFGNIIGEVDLRWSEKCKSNWAKVVSKIGVASISTTVTRISDGLSDSYSSNQYSSIYNDMVYSPGPAKACGTINSHQNCIAQGGSIQEGSTINNPSVDFNLPEYRQNNPFWVAGYGPPNCTWYVNGRMKQLGYSSRALDRMLGNANQWPAQGGNDVTLSSTAKLGAIAEWNSNVGGAGSLGHVAVVEQINSDGSIIITESNWAGQVYDRRTISPNNGWPSQFILVPKG